MKNETYSFVKKLDDGLITLNHCVHGHQMWELIKVRKHRCCFVTGKLLVGLFTYAPITNKSNKEDRISIEAMRKFYE